MSKIILITGSSRGIGKAVAKLARKQGYRVILHGRTDSEEVKQTCRELPGSEYIYFDAADKEAVDKTLSSLIERIGAVDVLVNSAGVASNFMKDLNDLDDEKALIEYRVNVLGGLHCIKAVLPAMLRKGSGSIVSVSSIKGYPNLSTMSTLTYAASKAGVISITKALAKSYPSIRFNVVSPGYVNTDQTKNWNEETYNRINSGTILGRIATPEEIAPMILFLASEDASYITGSDFLIDGGYAIKGK